MVKLSRFEVKLSKKNFFKKFFLKKIIFFYSVKRQFFLKKIAQKTAHFDGRWYFCLRAQGPRVDSRPLVLVAPHPGQTITYISHNRFTKEG